ncbi:pilus assembly protein, partial [Shigella sonnei]|nr:pilus assembly protein [Shigella sonnei]
MISAVPASLTVVSVAQAGIPAAIDANPEWAVAAGRWSERLKQWAETEKHYENQINAY